MKGSRGRQREETERESLREGRGRKEGSYSLLVIVRDIPELR